MKKKILAKKTTQKIYTENPVSRDEQLYVISYENCNFHLCLYLSLILYFSKKEKIIKNQNIFTKKKSKSFMKLAQYFCYLNFPIENF